jgi:predicted nucleic acid-binding protein
MAEDKEHIEKEALSTVEESRVGPTVLFDSSFILALLNPRDPNHQGVSAIWGFIKPFNCCFYIPAYVFAEVVSKRIHQLGTVSLALKEVGKFLEQVSGLGAISGGGSLTLVDMINRYKELARKKIRFLQSNDFFIVSEGILLKSLILTCDDKMYKKVKTYYKDIYFVAKHSTKYKDDTSKFIKRFEQMT